MMDGWGAWGWFGMVGVGLLFWGLVIWFVVTMAHRVGDSPRHDARDVLDERYARGEIGADEYRTRRETLRGSS
jgi:putative membrane protein